MIIQVHLVMIRRIDYFNCVAATVLEVHDIQSSARKQKLWLNPFSTLKSGEHCSVKMQLDSSLQVLFPFFFFLFPLRDAPLCVKPKQTS